MNQGKKNFLNKPWYWQPGCREWEIWLAKQRRDCWSRKRIAKCFQITQERTRQIEVLMEDWVRKNGHK